MLLGLGGAAVAIGIVAMYTVGFVLSLPIGTATAFGAFSVLLGDGNLTLAVTGHTYRRSGLNRLGQPMNSSGRQCDIEASGTGVALQECTPL